MFQQILDTEKEYNALLPAQRLAHGPSPQLLQAAEAWSNTVWATAKRLGPMPITKQQVNNGFCLAQNPVFICGVHRSGTTLVRNLLDAHPQLSVLPSEGTFYTNQEAKLHKLPENDWAVYLGTEWLRRLVNPINQPPYWLLGRSTIKASPYVDFARYVLAWWQLIEHKSGTQWPHTAIVLAYAACTNNLSAKFWVDKTPTNERFLQRIWQEMPQAKIIHLIREPIATVASRRAMEPGVSMGHILNNLETSYLTALNYSEQNNPRFLLLRYEQLCNEPEQLTTRIAEFLTIDNSDMLRRATVAGMPAKANSSFKKDTVSGQVHSTEKHEQNNLISATGQWQIAAYIGHLANELGYPLPKTSIVKSVWRRVKSKLFT